jgi:excisionase family DNA binding protein
VERQLLRIAETAEALGIGLTRTYELTRKGEIPSIRVGKSVRVPITALKLWIEAKVGASERDSNDH